jgi:hypothetical protein
MREIRLYGSEGGGAVRSSYPYPGWNVRSARVFGCRFRTVMESGSSQSIFSQLQGDKDASLSGLVGAVSARSTLPAHCRPTWTYLTLSSAS